LYKSFKLNGELFREFNFTHVPRQIFCLSNNYASKEICIKHNSDDFNIILDKSDIIILSTKWSQLDTDNLQNIISDLKNRGKKIIIANNTPEFEVIPKFGGIFTILDDFIYVNKRNYADVDKSFLKEKYYSNQKDISIINNLLENFVKKNNLTLFDRYSLICNNANKSCLFMTDKNEKIIYDYGHFTLEGAKYIGIQIFNKKII
jgi:hypothetical protein